MANVTRYDCKRIVLRLQTWHYTFPLIKCHTMKTLSKCPITLRFLSHASASPKPHEMQKNHPFHRENSPCLKCINFCLEVRRCKKFLLVFKRKGKHPDSLRVSRQFRLPSPHSPLRQKKVGKSLFFFPICLQM